MKVLISFCLVLLATPLIAVLVLWQVAWNASINIYRDLYGDL